ncbi:MAG TPA: hypothetical protein PLF78_14850 [Caulobacter sp.]|nr:hypothetical protein [Caulobacter sp.]
MKYPSLEDLVDKKRGMGPLDRRGQLLTLLVGVAAMVAIGWSKFEGVRAGRPLVRAVLEASDITGAEVRYTLLAGCRRGSTGFRWRSATKHGTACSSTWPRPTVELSVAHGDPIPPPR